MIRIPALAAAVLALSATIAQAAPAWTSSGVNFREGPGTWHPVIAHLPRCAAVEIGGYEGGWAHVEWQGRWGWVAQSYLRQSNAHCNWQPSHRPGHSGGYGRRY